MRHHRILLAALFATSCYAQPPCSLHSVRGTWAYQGYGTLMTPAPVPFAVLGIRKIDTLGRYTAHATISVGGQIQEVDYSGAIEVRADCTATDTYKSGTLDGVDRLVILDYGTQMRSMPTTSPLGAAAAMFTHRRLAWGDAQCSDHMVRGLYGGPREGTQMMPIPGQLQPAAIPFSAIHTATFQGGTGTAASTASLGGTIVDFEFPKVSIEVKADCTAVMKYTAISKQFFGQTFTGTVRYIVLNNGNELMGMDTEANPGLTAVALDDLKRISF